MRAEHAERDGLRLDRPFGLRLERRAGPHVEGAAVLLPEELLDLGFHDGDVADCPRRSWNPVETPPAQQPAMVLVSAGVKTT